MIPLKLTISGFLSYQKETVVDFSALHTACITGQNGAGKSSLMDAITWVLFERARIKDDSLINDQVSPRRAEVTFDFLFEEQEYRIHRTREEGKTGSVYFYIRDAESDSWRELTEKTKTQTDKKIESVLHMDYEVFTNASFFLQGKADAFTSQSATNRKKILSEILNLEIWETYKARAAEKRKEVERVLAGLDKDIEEDRKELDEESARKEAVDRITEALSQAEAARQEADEAYEAVRKIVQRFQGLNDEVSRLREQENKAYKAYQGTQETLGKWQGQKQECEAKLENEAQIEADYVRYYELSKLKEGFDQAQRAYNDRRSKAEKLDGTVNRTKATLEQTVRLLSRTEQDSIGRPALIAELESKLQKMEARISELKQQVSAEAALRTELTDLSSAIGAADSERTRLKNEADRIAEETENIRSQENAPCPSCGRIMDKEHIAKLLAAQEEKIVDLRKQYSQQNSIANNAGKRMSEVSKALGNIKVLHNELNRIEREAAGKSSTLEKARDDQQKWENGDALQLQTAREKLETGAFCMEERQQLVELHAAMAMEPYDEEAHLQCEREFRSLAGAVDRHHELESAKQKIGLISENIGNFENTLLLQSEDWKEKRDLLNTKTEELGRMQADLPDEKAARERKAAADDAVTRLNRDLGAAQQKLEVLDDVRNKLAGEESARKEQNRLLERWKKLEKYCSKSGIPALLIEQTLPQLEEQANLFLARLTNDRMSLRFETQQAYSDKTRTEAKEVLDIKISDEFGTRSYELFSGGEAFRINFAVRLALSRILSQRAGARLQTLVIDEGFGSQDEEGRSRLIDAISAIEGDFEKILIITHLSELKDAFPSRIEVTKDRDGSSVEVIP